MTTICSDGRTVAADGLRCTADEPVQHDSIKIVRIDDAVVGFTGNSRFRDPAIRWWRAGCPDDGMPKTPAGDIHEWDLVVFRENGVVIYAQDNPYPSNVFPYPFAVGTGADFALGALHAGALPRAAIAIAIKCNIRTGGQILELPLKCTSELRDAAE